MIIGIGTDIIEIDRFKDVLGRHEGRFVERVFTRGEQKYCNGMGHREAHYAARFAAKEAVLKALGTGWTGGIHWTDVEVTREAVGKASVKLGGVAAKVAKKLGVKKVHVSISHSQEYATATAVAER
jgi:holo-[acyl-carrier protein] synthase